MWKEVLKYIIYHNHASSEEFSGSHLTLWYIATCSDQRYLFPRVQHYTLSIWLYSLYIVYSIVCAINTNSTHQTTTSLCPELAHKQTFGLYHYLCNNHVCLSKKQGVIKKYVPSILDALTHH